MKRAEGSRGLGQETPCRTLVARALGALAALTLVAGCGFPKTVDKPPPALSAAQVEKESQGHPGTTQASLNGGRDAFVAKCNGCHGYPDLSTIADDKWPDIVKRMGKKSDLDEQQTAQVLGFIRASRTP